MKDTDMEQTVRSVIRRMTASSVMNLAFARNLIREVEKKAQEMGVKAVGRPVAIECMDGAYIGSFDVALNKTFTSVAFQMSTAELGKLASPGGSLYGIQNTNDGKIVIFGGGEPLYVDDVLIGAIGVSGGTAEQDTALGAYGKNIAKEVISWK